MIVRFAPTFFRARFIPEGHLILIHSALTPGVVAVIQTFGDRINLHPHLHFLVTEGGVDEAGVFHKIPRIDDSRLAEIFAREVMAAEAGSEYFS